MLLAVEIKIFSSWVTFCDFKVLPVFMKMCELAEIYRHGTETPIKKNPDVGTHFTSNGKHAEVVQV